LIGDVLDLALIKFSGREISYTSVDAKFTSSL